MSVDSANLSKSQKNHILKKSQFFLSKIGSRDVKTGPIGKRGQSQVRINIPYKPTNIIFRYENMTFLLIFSLTILAELVTENISKNFIFLYRKMIFERGYFRSPGRGGKNRKIACPFFSSDRTTMRRRALERFTSLLSQKIVFVVIG